MSGLVQAALGRVGRTALLLAVLAVGALGRPSSARADDAAMSRFHFEQGSEHYAGGRFERAVHEFMTAQRLSPNPRTLYNIGICFLRMSRHDDAFFFLDEYLASSDDAEGAADRRRFAADSLRGLAPHVARVSVGSQPAGATIYVDQREHGSYGLTPRVLALPPGAHRVWVELPGHRSADAQVVAETGAEVVVALAPQRIVGALVVTGPAGTARVLDGAGTAVAEGTLPLEVALPPGRVEIEVSAAGHRPFRAFATIAADARTELRAEPEALPPPTGDLTVTANVADAVVELGGSPLGLSPLVLVDLAVGGHDVTVHAPGHRPWAGHLEVEASTRSWLTVQLSPEPEGRTPWTWVIGGVGAAGLVGWATLGALALARADEFRTRWNVPGGGDVVPLRDETTALALASDVTLAASVAALSVAVVLFFATDDSGRSASSATTTQRPR